MANRWRRKNNENNGEPAIDAIEVNEAEVDPIGSREQGKYTGRLLSPEEVFSIEPNGFDNLSGSSNNESLE